MTKQIPLTQDKFALVDDVDYDFLMQWKWCFLSDKKEGGYAIRKGKTSHILMHRIVNKTPLSFETDHRDGNKLNNQKDNLRNCSKSQNNGNRKRYNKKRIGKYKGVYWIEKIKKWKAKLSINYKEIHIGYFDREEDAALAYNFESMKYFGEYSRQNNV